MKQNEMIISRLKNAVASVRLGVSESLIAVLRSDIYEVFHSYMQIEPRNIDIEINEDNEGGFIINVKAQVARLYESGKIID